MFSSLSPRPPSFAVSLVEYRVNVIVRYYCLQQHPSPQSLLLWLTMWALETRLHEKEHPMCKRGSSVLTFMPLKVSKQNECTVKKMIVPHQWEQVKWVELWKGCPPPRPAVWDVLYGMFAFNKTTFNEHVLCAQAQCEAFPCDFLTSAHGKHELWVSRLPRWRWSTERSLLGHCGRDLGSRTLRPIVIWDSTSHHNAHAWTPTVLSGSRIPGTSSSTPVCTCHSPGGKAALSPVKPQDGPGESAEVHGPRLSFFL